jgi:hypothetical protein
MRRDKDRRSTAPGSHGSVFGSRSSIATTANTAKAAAGSIGQDSVGCIV